jgi:hypothetical protein
MKIETCYIAEIRFDLRTEEDEDMAIYYADSFDFNSIGEKYGLENIDYYYPEEWKEGESGEGIHPLRVIFTGKDRDGLVEAGREIEEYFKNNFVKILED